MKNEKGKKMKNEGGKKGDMKKGKKTNSVKTFLVLRFVQYILTDGRRRRGRGWQRVGRWLGRMGGVFGRWVVFSLLDGLGVGRFVGRDMGGRDMKECGTGMRGEGRMKGKDVVGGILRDTGEYAKGLTLTLVHTVDE